MTDVGVLAQKDYLKNGLQTFEKNVNDYLLEKKRFKPIYHNYRGENSLSYPFSRTVSRYKAGKKIKEKAEGFDKVFIPSQNRLTFNPEDVDAQIIPYIHDILPFTAYYSTVDNKGLHKVIEGVQDYIIDTDYLSNIEKLEKVIVASETTADDLRNRTSFDGEIEVVYQGVDRMPEDKFDNQQRDFDLVYTGTLHERKNPEMLRETFKKAQKQGFKVASINYEEIDLPGKTFTNISDFQMAEILSNSRFYLHPSFIEGFGRGPVEAQRYGCIPLALDRKINREILGMKHYSWINISEPEDVIELLKKDVKPEMRENCRKNSNQYSWSRCQKQIEEVLLQ